MFVYRQSSCSFESLCNWTFLCQHHARWSSQHSTSHVILIFITKPIKFLGKKYSPCLILYKSSIVLWFKLGIRDATSCHSNDSSRVDKSNQIYNVNNIKQVRVTIEGSAQYEILEGNTTEAAANQSAAGTHSVCIAAQDKQTISVRWVCLLKISVRLY